MVFGFLLCPSWYWIFALVELNVPCLVILLVYNGWVFGAPGATTKSFLSPLSTIVRVMVLVPGAHRCGKAFRAPPLAPPVNDEARCWLGCGLGNGGDCWLIVGGGGLGVC